MQSRDASRFAQELAGYRGVDVARLLSLLSSDARCDYFFLCLPNPKSGLGNQFENKDHRTHPRWRPPP
jgi:hypothetical protein